MTGSVRFCVTTCIQVIGFDFAFESDYLNLELGSRLIDTCLIRRNLVVGSTEKSRCRNVHTLFCKAPNQEKSLWRNVRILFEAEAIL